MSNFYDQMREAAETLIAIAQRMGCTTPETVHFTAKGILCRADEFEAEEQAAAEQEALVEQLAQTIHDHGDPHGAWEDARDFVQDPIRSSARAILAQFDVTPKTTGAQQEQG